MVTIIIDRKEGEENVKVFARAFKRHRKCVEEARSSKGVAYVLLILRTLRMAGHP